MTARPAPDSRVVEQFAARILYAVDEGADDAAVFQETGDDPLVGYIMNATIDYRVAARSLLSIPGYLVLDPKSDELVERIADVLVMFVIFGERTHALDVARAIAANLGGGK